MAGSILQDTKRMLDIGPDDTSFDGVVLTHINGVLATLDQMGIGPAGGLYIDDADATWDLLIGSDQRYNMVKPFVYLKVRLAFDPPATSFVLTAFQEQITEHTWRLSVLRESVQWRPAGETFIPDTTILDGGSA